MTEYYTLSDERAEAIAQLAKISVAKVREFCCADWPEGDEHQEWLNTAPVAEIANWIPAGFGDPDLNDEE